MSNLELRPEWFLSTSSLNTGQGLLHNDNEQTTVGGRPWPRVQAHAVNELAKKRSVGSVALAVEFWKEALQPGRRQRSQAMEETRDWWTWFGP